MDTACTYALLLTDTGVQNLSTLRLSPLLLRVHQLHNHQQAS